jgi:hypothetical protein
MKLGAVMVSGFVLLAPPLSQADFKYTESTKITGGVLGGLMKFASRVGGKGSWPDSSTYYVQGNNERAAETPADEPDANGSSLMKATTEVTSFSSSKLDPALFVIPAQYRQIQNKKGGQ